MTLATRCDRPPTELLPELAKLMDSRGQIDSLMLGVRARPDLFGGVPMLNAELVPAVRRPDIRRQLKLNLETLAGSDSLSPREREVLRLVSQGYTNLEIAKKLFISDVTVKVHVRHILAKLGVRNRAEAAALAVKQLRDDQRSEAPNVPG